MAISWCFQYKTKLKFIKYDFKYFVKYSYMISIKNSNKKVQVI